MKCRHRRRGPMSSADIETARRRAQQRVRMRMALAAAFSDVRLLDSGGLLVVPRAIWNGWRAALLRTRPHD